MIRPLTPKKSQIPVLTVALLLLSVVSVLPAEAQRSQLSPGTEFGVADVLDVASARVLDLSRDGRWAAVSVSSLRGRLGNDNYRYGDPTYIRPSQVELWIFDTRSGDASRVFPGSRNITQATWSPNGRHLAVMEARDQRYTAWIWDRENGSTDPVSLPANRELAGGAPGGIEWTADGDALLLSLHPEGWRDAAATEFERLTKGPIVVQSSEEPFLAWEALRRRSGERSLVRYDVEAGSISEVIPTTALGNYRMTADGARIVYEEDITEKTSYDVIFGRTNTIKVIPVGGGEPATVLESDEDIRATWSNDNTHFAYSKEGDVFLASLDDPEPRRLTGEEEPEGEETAPGTRGRGEPDPGSGEDEEDERVRYSVSSVGPRGEWVVASSEEGLWLIDQQGNEPVLFVERDEDDDFAPSVSVMDWTPDGGGIYLTSQSRREWDRAILHYDIERRRMTELARSDRSYSGIRLSEDGNTFVFSSAQGADPTDLYAVDSDFNNPRRLTTLNPDLEGKNVARAGLISYLDVDGDSLHAVVYYPADYQPGLAYPTIFIVYERFFDPRFNGTVNVLTSNGYVVVNPTVDLEIGYPAEAWVKGVTAAANKLIEIGVSDPERLGVHGTSYGGYATNLLVTQTDRFKAAINISGKVDMISFYTDSPRLGVRNIHAPEKSQDRIGATLWEQPQKYVAHSAIMYADRIDTPLLLITGEQDHNVPARTTMEMFYALRRLDKTVEWVTYVDGGHGMPTMNVEVVEDYHQRILDWYAKYLTIEEEETSEG